MVTYYRMFSRTNNDLAFSGRLPVAKNRLVPAFELHHHYITQNCKMRFQLLMMRLGCRINNSPSWNVHYIIGNVLKIVSKDLADN